MSSAAKRKRHHAGNTGRDAAPSSAALSGSLSNRPSKVRLIGRGRFQDRTVLNSPQTVRLQDMPPEIVRRIFAYILDLPEEGVLDHLSIVNLEHAFALSCSHRRLHQILTGMFHSIDWGWRRVLHSDEVHLFATSARHISLPFCFESADVFLELIRYKVPIESVKLEPPLMDPELHKRVLDFFCTFVLVSCARILYLDLKFSELSEIDIDCTRLKPALSNLKALALGGLSTCLRSKLTQLLSPAGNSLVHLELYGVGLGSVSNLMSIRNILPRLRNLSLFHLIDVSSSDCADLAISYGSRLRVFNMFSHFVNSKNRLSGNLFSKMMKSCTGLRNASVDETLFRNPELTLKALQLRSATLQALSFSNCALTIDYIEKLGVALPELKELEFHDHIISNRAVVTACFVFGPRLDALVIKGNLLSKEYFTPDDVILSIGNCIQLTRLEFDVRLYSKADTHESLFMGGSISAFADMLKEIGCNLRMLSTCGYIRWSDLSSDYCEQAVEEQSGAEMLKLIWTYCHKLEQLRTLHMKPELGSTRYYDKACVEIKRRLSNTALYLERAPPRRFGRTWSGHEINYD